MCTRKEQSAFLLKKRI